MAPTPPLQTLAFHARDLLPRDRGPQDGAESTFETVVDVYEQFMDCSDEAGLRAHAVDTVTRVVAEREGMPSDLRQPVERFVAGMIGYLAAQYPTVEELRRDRWMLSRLFCAHLQEATRVAWDHELARAGESVTLRDYMTTRPGDYLVAETKTSVEVDQLDPEIADLVVEEFVVGVDGSGRRTVHLHAATSHVHVLTCVMAEPAAKR